jgi:hypothetical protein
LSVDNWNNVRHKFGYSQWFDKKLTNTLYNIKPIIEGYRKLQNVPLEHEKLDTLRTKLDAWTN